jgi:enoyl-CoA hydratase/carnithine racemase
VTPSTAPVRYDCAGGVATISLARPHRRNAMTVTMIKALFELLDRADEDPAIRAVIVTGEGSSFCVGADIRRGSRVIDKNLGDIAASRTNDDEDGAADVPYREPAGLINERIIAMHKPVIGAVNGDAVGGGATILCAMDARLAAVGSRIGFVFARLGLVTEGAASWLLPRLVGMSVALDWLVSGRLVDAEESLRAGFVRSLHPREQLHDAATEFAHALTDGTAPASVALTRHLLWKGSTLPTLAAAHELESRLIRERLKSADGIEGVQALLERRAPRFDPAVREQMPAWLRG